MELGNIILYFILGLSLFFTLNYFIAKEKENNSIHAILPIIYIILLAGLLESIGYSDINDNIFMVIVFELVIRLYYDKTILKREDLTNNKFYFQIYSVSIVGGYFINQIFISKVDSIFLTASEMRLGIWIFIVLFLYTIFKNCVRINVSSEQTTFISRKRGYVLVNYARLKNQYLKVVKCKNKELIPLIYAIMIYENYNRPSFFRKVDRIIYRFTGKETKMGIMQIPSNVELSDEDSIKLAIKKINTLDTNIKASKNKVKEIMEEYYLNSNYIQDVLDIYNTILEFNQN